MKLNLILLVLISLVLAFCSFSESKKVRKIKRLPSPARLTKYPQHTRFQRPRRPRNKKRTPHGKSKHRHPKPEPDHVSTRKSEMFLRAAAAPASSSNAVLDVGQVTVVSISQSCNGVLLDPSLVLTSASCVYLNHNSKAYAEINFVLNRVVKKVKEVYGIPEWLRSGERKADFALLLLARPMTNIQSALTSLTWSPYALEDIGESFLATPSPSSCRTASKKAQNTQIIRDVGDNIITVSCGNAGMASAGSPFYRRVGGRNVIYGVYFGQCTSGSMDRKTSGLCGSRITKQVFEDFCTLAKSEQIDLPDCSSKLLTSLNPYLPTEVTSSDAYEAVTSTAENLKGAVILYHTSESSKYIELLKDIDSIQRDKKVYDKFQMAVVDTTLLPYQLKYTPYIEFRTAGADRYLPYSDSYDFKQFHKFMVDFSVIGAPPVGSTSFMQHLKVVTSKRSTTSRKRKLEPQSSDIEVDIPGKKPKPSNCDVDKGQVIIEDTMECACNAGYIGSGTTGNCQDLLEVVKVNCRYDVEEGTAETGPTAQTYDQLKQLTTASTWCSKVMFVFSYLREEVASVDVSGEDLTPDHCDEVVQDLVMCEEELPLMADRSVRNNHTKHHRGHNSNSGRYKREVKTLAQGTSAKYLSSFQKNQPPPIVYSPNSYFIYQDWVKPAAKGKFSTLFDGARGIAEYTGYKVTQTNLKKLKAKKTASRNLISSSWHVEKDLAKTVLQGKNNVYAGRGNKKFRNAVDKGHLNPSQINSYDKNTMKLTHTYTNAYPQYSFFNIGVWKSYEKKIFDYAKGLCVGKSTNAEFYAVTGLSDYKIVNKGKSKAKKSAAQWWPSGKLPAKIKPIKKAESMWTIGCCSWTSGATLMGESVSIWANNEIRWKNNQEHQPTPPVLANALYPAAKAGFKFFPGNPDCSDAAHHLNL